MPRNLILYFTNFFLGPNLKKNNTKSNQKVSKNLKSSQKLPNSTFWDGSYICSVRKLVIPFLKYPLPAAIPRSLTKNESKTISPWNFTFPIDTIRQIDPRIHSPNHRNIWLCQTKRSYRNIEILGYFPSFKIQSLSEAGYFACMHKSLNFLKRGALHTFFYVIMLQFAYTTKLELTTENSRRE